jgi:SAM-dependent methyltransferase
MPTLVAVRDPRLQSMLDLDDRHWWFAGRRRIVRAQLDRIELPFPAHVLDVGCGSGRNLVDLARLGPVAGVELSEQAAAVATARGVADVRIGPVESLPWTDETFDLVTCLDVLEHTPDDRLTLRELRRVTRSGGVLLLTVPAYPSLWSAHDVVSGHHRRYRARTLTTALTETGWSLARMTAFNTLLLAPAALVRIAQRRRSGPPRGRRSELELTPGWLNGVLEQPLRAEAALLRRGVRLPIGLSLLAVAYKKGR